MILYKSRGTPGVRHTDDPDRPRNGVFHPHVRDGAHAVKVCTGCGGKNYRKASTKCSKCERPANASCRVRSACVSCGRRRLKDHPTGHCTKCDPARHQRNYAKQKAIYQSAFEHKPHGARGRAHNETPREPRPIECQVCYDLPHRRPANGCACGRPYAEAPIANHTSVIRSSLASVCKVGGW